MFYLLEAELRIDGRFYICRNENMYGTRSPGHLLNFNAMFPLIVVKMISEGSMLYVRPLTLIVHACSFVRHLQENVYTAHLPTGNIVADNVARNSEYGLFKFVRSSSR